MQINGGIGESLLRNGDLGSIGVWDGYTFGSTLRLTYQGSVLILLSLVI